MSATSQPEFGPMGAAADERLVIEDLSVVYGAVTACRDISLEVSAGRCLAVVGANGSGKSSMMRGIAGVVPLASGRVHLGGRDLGSSPAHVRARAGLALVPEGRHLFPEMTIHETLMLATAYARGGPWTPVGAYELFPRLGKRRDALAANLSGGEAQMLAIARALMLNPRIILLDEPSSGLAPAVMIELTQTLGALLEQGLGLLLVEQNIQAARKIADEVIVLENSVVTQRGGVDILQSGKDLRRAYLGI